jgi:hypothetical protein
MASEWIAEEQVVFVFPNGTRRDGRIAIGLPVRDHHDARCPVALDGLQQCGPIFGASTAQALLLAIRFLGVRLHDFLSRGGRVVYPEGVIEQEGGRGDVDIPLGALFGPLLCAPEPVRDDEHG